MLFVVFVATVGIPFWLRTDQQPAFVADDVVVIITPHNEAIRSEFARGFSSWYKDRTGRTAAVDWRVIGGSSEIARFLALKAGCGIDLFFGGGSFDLIQQTAAGRLAIRLRKALAAHFRNNYRKAERQARER